ncbi:hypothetical protein HU720_14420 [Pseudomonas sp. SWRI51]|uniref:hypothetical protein n=1 Tax=Pseudomonas sp. SWRI51 TaxID=2745491 RepID=UPI0016475F73|nr:hypothetical protein [Pseudomonas sp. SWRI51]MBC3412494.1 hypothetical protein [Pseudomonas sp. SWRI51]
MKILAVTDFSPLISATVLRSSPNQQRSPAVEGDQVSLSEQGLATAKTKNEIWALHARIYGPRGLDQQVGAEYRALGSEEFKRLPPPEGYSAADAERFTMTLKYLDGIEKLRGTETKFDENPFWGMGRDELAAIEMDEQRYTKEERYAAYRAKSALDNMYFVKLGDYYSNTQDHRPLLKGYLEYLDNLTPVERLNYPEGERAAVAARLAAAEREMGSLPADFSLWKYINWDPKGRLNLEAMLDPAIGGPVPTSEASAIAQASGQTKGVGETDTAEKIRLDR